MKRMCTPTYVKFGWMGPQKSADTPQLGAGKLFRYRCWQDRAFVSNCSLFWFLGNLQCCVELREGSTLSYSPACLLATRIISYGKWDHQNCNLLMKSWVLIIIVYTIYTSTLPYMHFPDIHFLHPLAPNHLSWYHTVNFIQCIQSLGKWPTWCTITLYNILL